MTILLAIAAGVVLAASAGLRAFVPLFAVGVASRTLGWDLATEMRSSRRNAGHSSWPFR